LEKIEILAANAPHIGKKCIYCEKEFAANDEVVECPRCHQLHHVDCWKANGGCARRGCPQVAQTIIGEPPAGDGPPPSMSRKHLLMIVGAVLAIVLVSILWPKSPDPAAGRIKIQVLLEASFPEQMELQQIINDFNATNTEIYIDLQTTTLSAIENQLLARMAAGDAPDIFSLPYARFERMQQELGAMYPLGDSKYPAYGVQHPSQLRVLSIFVYTEHPQEALTVLRYLVSEMPRQDLTELKEQNRIIDPELMLDIDTFLSLTSQ